MDPKVAEKLKAKFGAASGDVRTGGKGTVRRKKKAFRKSTSQDDKRLQSTLKKLNVNNIPAIEEVNLFKDDGTVIHFNNPKVQASIAANTYVVSGEHETKKLQDLLPGIINQLGPDNFENLKQIAASYASQDRTGAAALAAAAAAGGGAEDDDDVPDLVESFEETSKKPADKPTDTDKPADKAADKPEVKPEDKPAEPGNTSC